MLGPILCPLCNRWHPDWVGCDRAKRARWELAHRKNFWTSRRIVGKELTHLLHWYTEPKDER